jgi:cleavage stimulation factor subunit 2
MQMAKCQQPSSSLPQPSHLSEPFLQPDPMIQVVSRPSSLPLNIPANATVLQESGTMLQNFPQYQHTSQSPVKVFFTWISVGGGHTSSNVISIP